MDDVYVGKINGSKAYLTTHSPQSHYGVPVLRIDDDSPYDFGPADMIEIKGQITTAAQVVVNWAKRGKRRKGQIGAAEAFIRWWPRSQI
jgi:hypothetical protein